MSKDSKKTKKGVTSGKVVTDNSDIDMPSPDVKNEMPINQLGILDSVLTNLGKRNDEVAQYDLGQGEDRVVTEADLNSKPVVSTGGLGLLADNYRWTNKWSVFTDQFPAGPPTTAVTPATPAKPKPSPPVKPRAKTSPSTPQEVKKQKSPEPNTKSSKLSLSPTIESGKSTEYSFISSRSESLNSYGGEPATGADSSQSLQTVSLGHPEILAAQKEVYNRLLTQFQLALDRTYPGTKVDMLYGTVVIIKPDLPTADPILTAQDNPLPGPSKQETKITPAIEENVLTSAETIEKEKVDEKLTSIEPLAITVKDIIKNKTIKIDLTKYLSSNDDRSDPRSLLKKHLKAKKLLANAHYLYDFASIKVISEDQVKE